MKYIVLLIAITSILILSSQNMSKSMYNLNQGYADLLTADSYHDSIGIYSISYSLDNTNSDSLLIFKVSLNTLQILSIHKTKTYSKRAFVHIDTASNIYIVLYNHIPGLKYDSINIIKYDENFTFQWARKIDSVPYQSNFTTNISEYEPILCFDPSIGYYILTSDKILKLGLNGNLLQVKKIKHKTYGDIWFKSISAFTVLDDNIYLSAGFDTPYNTNNSTITSNSFKLNKNIEILKQKKNGTIGLLRNGNFTVIRDKLWVYNKGYYTFIIDTNLSSQFNSTINWGSQYFMVDSFPYLIHYSFSNHSSTGKPSIVKRVIDSNYKQIYARIYLYDNNDYLDNSIRYKNYFTKDGYAYVTNNYLFTNKMMFLKVRLDSIDKIGFPSYEFCDTPTFSSKQFFVDDTLIYFDTSTYAIQSIPNPLAFTSSNSTLSTAINTAQGCFSAYFTLPRDTFCLNDTLDLLSDTCVKHGQSIWRLDYPSDSDIRHSRDYENILFKQKGEVIITHIHNLAGCTDTFKDTIVVLDSAGLAVLYIGNDTMLCQSELPYTLSAFHPVFLSYQWQDGSTDSVFTATDTGIYWVRVTSDCGTQTDTIKIYCSSDSISIFDTLCRDTLPILFNNVSLTSSGVYRDTLKNSRGGDSFVFYHLTVKDTYSYHISASICYGDSFLFQGSYYKVAGSYQVPYATRYGCDSTYTLNLSVHALDTTDITESKCQGQTYDFYGTTITTDGVYYHQFVDKNGCDSTIRLSITFKPTSQYSYTHAICSGDSYIFGGKPLSSAGVYRDTLPNHLNCDSIITLTLTTNKVLRDSIDVTICDGSSFMGATTSGEYRLSLKSSNGCDSIVSISLSVLPPKYTRSDTITVCDGYLYNGILYKKDTALTHIISNYLGCDSVEEIRYIFIENASPKLVDLGSQYFCDSVTIRGVFYQSSFVYRDTIQSFIFPYCDSVILEKEYFRDERPVLDISISPSDTIYRGETIRISASGGNHYRWNSEISSHTLIEQPGYSTQYIVKGWQYDEDCYAEKAVTITVLDREVIGFPNSFSPNGDLLNDTFKPNVKGSVKNYQLIIFNRWGEKVFHTRDYMVGWDGIYRNQPAPQGVYIYTVRYVINREIFEKMGEVMIVK